jgi:hypothetical protein
LFRRRRQVKKATELARLLVALDDAARERRSSLPRRNRLSIGAR